MASHGAFRAAARFHDIAQKIDTMAGVGDEALLELQSLILQWHNEGAEPAFMALVNQLGKERQRVERAADASAKGGLTYTARPEDVRLAMSFEEVRMATAIALAKDDEVGRSLADFTKSAQAQVAVLSDRSRRSPKITEEQAQNRIQGLNRAQMYWKALVTALAPRGVNPPVPSTDASKPGSDSSRPSNESSKASAPAIQPETAADSNPLLDAWRAIGSGDAAKALAKLDEADQEEPWTMFGRGLALELSGKNSDASRAYDKLVQEAPLTALGGLAYVREEALSHVGGLAIPNTSAFDGFSKTIPSWVDGLVEKPWTFESLLVEPVSPKVAPLEKASVRVRLRNLAPVPLSIGAGCPINTRLLFSPLLDAAGQAQNADGEVVEVDRRLRLMPGEELDCTVWPEVGQAGYLIEKYAASPSRLRWRVLQGFEAQGDAARHAGPGCLDVQVDAVSHDALPEARLNSDELAAKIMQAGDSQLPATLIAARALVLAKDAGSQKVIDAVVQRYLSWSATGRMLALGALPCTAQFPALKQLDDQLAKEADPRVLLVGVVARAKSADDPILGSAAGSANTALAKVAGTQRDRLKAGIKTYSQVGMVEKVIQAPAPTP
jgi:hypothetical protein